MHAAGIEGSGLSSYKPEKIIFYQRVKDYFCKGPFKYKAVSVSKCLEFISKELKTFTEEKQGMSYILT